MFEITKTREGLIARLDGVEIEDYDEAWYYAQLYGAVDDEGNIASGTFDGPSTK